MAFVTLKLLNVRVTFSEDLFERLRPTVPSPNPNDLRWKSKQQASVLSQRFVEEVSPRSGPNNVAHGVSRGSSGPPSPPAPSPAPRGRGTKGGGGRCSQGSRLKASGQVSPWAKLFRPPRRAEPG
jgi:hypothetical protein